MSVMPVAALARGCMTVVPAQNATALAVLNFTAIIARMMMSDIRELATWLKECPFPVKSCETSTILKYVKIELEVPSDEELAKLKISSIMDGKKYWGKE